MLVGAFSILLAGLLMPTDFGIRDVGKVSRTPTLVRTASPKITPAASRPSFRIADATQIGARFGRVTSTLRSVQGNRRVGGVPNSWHLSGRAMDIARRPGVSHSMIAAELRRSGFHLLESLDEGDHSHFAFGDDLVRRSPRRVADQLAEIKNEADFFRFVLAPSPDNTSSKAAVGEGRR
jgi:hypothetical protein